MKIQFKIKPALETIIIIGLSLKLLLTLIFILFFPTSPDLPLQAQTAQAQDKPPAKTAGPVPGQPTAPDKSATKPAKTGVGQEKTAGKDKPTSQVSPDSLDARELALRRKEERLQERERALEALEKQIRERMGEIEATRQKLAELVKKQEALVEEQKVQKNARIEHLVTAYKGMRPEKAGVLMDSLDDEVAVNILSAMPGKSAGQILAYVSPTKAARLTKAISLRQGTPPPDTGGSPTSEEPQAEPTPSPAAEVKPPAAFAQPTAPAAQPPQPTPARSKPKGR